MKNNRIPTVLRVILISFIILSVLVVVVAFATDIISKAKKNAKTNQTVVLNSPAASNSETATDATVNKPTASYGTSTAQTNTSTATPTKTSIATGTKAPAATPTKAPTATGTKAPTATPTKAPTATPTKAPTTHIHSFSTTYQTDSESHWLACNCGEKKNVGLHSFEEKTTKTASCEKDGEKQSKCSICGYTITKTIPAIGHSEVIDEEVLPTFDTPGKTKGKHCSVCGKILEAQITIPALLSYTLKDDGTYQVDGFSGNTYESLIIPETYQGKKVTSIANNAFKNTNIKSIELTPNITIIGSSAFENCSRLETFDLPKSVRKIGDNAFTGCSKIVIPITSNITKDTTLDVTNKIYILNSDVQIKNTATLTIKSGVCIIGNHFSIINYGSLIIAGNENNMVEIYGLEMDSGNTNYQACTFDLSYMNLHTGSFSPPGDAGSSSICIDHCGFFDSDYHEFTYIWYPEECIIQNSYFDNWAVISIGTRNSAIIRNNTFYRCGSDIYDEPYQSVICCWASYGGAIEVKNNNFIQPFRFALSLKSDSSDIDAQYNWFDTTDSEIIAQLIWDGDDDFSIPETIDYSNYLLSQHN